MPLNTGEILHDRYRVVKLIGQGGFGAVYRAWDLTLQRPCAIKENYETSESAARQFNREATILANLNHPSLPDVSDYFNIPGHGQYLVMEFVEGQDLQQIIDQRGGPLPEAQLIPWIDQVCDALGYLHSQSSPVIHRDIKPANIKVTPQGTVKLVDFGIAKIYQPELKTTSGAQAVTPGYSPPEQYGKGNTDARSDIYALGATVYSALTTQKPVDSIQRQIGHPLPSPRFYNQATSPQVDAAVMGAMQLPPDLRYQNTQEFKTALHAPTIPEPLIPISATVVSPAAAPVSVASAESGEGITQPKKTRPGWLIPLIIILCVFCLASIVTGYLVMEGLPTSGQATNTQEAMYRNETFTAIALIPSSSPTSPTLSLTPTIQDITLTPTTSLTPLPTRTRTPTPSLTPGIQTNATWYPCSGYYASRLRPGERAYVSYNPPLANNVRQSPSLSAKLLGKIQPGEEMEILDGPECNNNMVWWRVQVIGKSLQGWTSEGELDEYWLVPMP